MSDWEGSESEEAMHVGPWPAFVDLFAASSLILLVFFVIVAFRYMAEVGDVVKVDQLFAELKSMERGSGFTVQRRPPDVLVILEEEVTFLPDSSTLSSMKPEGRETLRKVMGITATKTGLIREVEILGHADRRGSPAKNWMLSAARAVAVAQFIVDSLGGDPCTIRASGRSSYFPRDPSLDPDTLIGQERIRSFRRDRRIEVLLHPIVAKSEAPGSICTGSR